MKIVKKLFGISTKNLYLLRYYVIRNVEFYRGETLWDSGHEYNLVATDNYVLARKKGEKYVDAFTGTKHNDDIVWPKNGAIVAKVISPIITTSNRIKYKDAEEILETKNTLVIKK